MSRSASSKPRLELKRVLSDEELERKPKKTEYERRGARTARSSRENSDSHRAVSSRDRPRDRESDRGRAEGRDRDRDRNHRGGKDREKDRHERGGGRHHRDHAAREGERVRERSHHHENGSKSHREQRRDDDSDEEDRTGKAMSRSSHELSVSKGRRDKGDRVARLNRTASDHQLDKRASKRGAEDDELTDDNDFSSEEEVEEEGQKVTRMRRSRSINREALIEPKLLEGWLGWLSEGMFFNRWKRGYFQLEYPFLNLYSETPPTSIRDRVNYKPKGKMSVRGGCLVDAKMVGDARNKDHVSKRFRIRSGQKEWIIEAESPAHKTAWVNALRTHIEYANPAKRANGVGYDCKANDTETPMRLNITLTDLKLTNMSTGQVEWSRSIRKLHKILESTTAAHVLLLDFHEWGGTTKLTFTNVPAKTIHACLSSVLATHVEWRGAFPAQD